MNPKNNKSQNSVIQNIKSGFYKGVGLAAGLFATSVFAAAAAMNVFAPGDVISAAQINENFTIAAPEGAIVPFYLAACPLGWAPADGTNGTPDLRGRFVRGLDDAGTGAAGVDPDGVRAPGNLQLDAFQGHLHQRNSSHLELVILKTGGGWFPSGSAFNGYDASDLNTTGNPLSDGTNGTPRTSSETRPTNVALIYCMRKN